MAPPPPDVANADVVIEELWRKSTDEILAIDPAAENWKSQVLPLARIKKIMKSEEGIMSEDKTPSGGDPSSASSSSQRFMIAGEAPVLLGKACELFVREVTMRAWRHTERNRRRTLQRQDVHAAVGESEVYDFLIDIVPRVTPTTGGKTYPNTETPAPTNSVPASAETTAATQVPPPGTAGSDASTMTVAQAESRLAHLQQVHEQYAASLQQQQMHAGPGPPMPPPQVVMNSYQMQMPPGQAAQWAGQAMRGQQQQHGLPGSDGQQSGPTTKEELT